jgi:hypothetical protein
MAVAGSQYARVENGTHLKPGQQGGNEAAHWYPAFVQTP